MKIWNTKYCLSKGILEHDVNQNEIMYDAIRIPSLFMDLHGEGKEWHRTKEAAQFRANEVRIKKLISLDKQIKKLEEAGEIKLYFDKELKFCPFCGEDDDLHVTIHEVLCGNCSASVGSMCKTTEINRKIWNTRVHKK